MQTEDIRKPAVAGLFYPAGAGELTRTLAQMFSEVKKESISGRPLALIAPHAGYPYSGRTAVKAYKLVEGEEYDSVVVVSPSHTVFFKGCSVYEGAGYETPLGVVEVDRELSRELANIHPSVYFSKMGHATGGTRGEHALEVQLPFIQLVLGKSTKLVAIVMGDQEEDTITALGETLAAGLKGKNVLMVASTDLSHFHSQKVAERLDGAIREAVVQFDPDLLVEAMEEGKGEACGGGIVAAVMKAAKRLGGKEVKFLEYTTSGQTTGDFDEVVGYMSAVIVSERQAPGSRELIGSPAAGRLRKKSELDLSGPNRERLHEIARRAIRARLDGQKFEPAPVEGLEAESGVFVTLKLHGELRGCIGMIRAREPLYRAVAEMADSAAFEDPRFPELSDEEYENLEYEISVLSPLERVRDVHDIQVGRDGLMVKMDFHSGLLLPQVAKEYGWDRVTLLEQTCLKAGLPKNSYREKQCEIYKFRAEVF